MILFITGASVKYVLTSGGGIPFSVNLLTMA